MLIFDRKFEYSLSHRLKLTNTYNFHSNLLKFNVYFCLHYVFKMFFNGIGKQSSKFCLKNVYLISKVNIWK